MTQIGRLVLAILTVLIFIAMFNTEMNSRLEAAHTLEENSPKAYPPRAWPETHISNEGFPHTHIWIDGIDCLVVQQGHQQQTMSCDFQGPRG